MRKSLPLLALLLACLGIVPAAAQAARHGAGFGFYRVDAYRLVFSDEQNKKLDAVLAPAGQEFAPLYKERMAELQKLRDMLKSEDAKDTDIRAQVTKISDIDYQIALKKANCIRAIRKIATPEQLTKIDALEAKRTKQRQKLHTIKVSPPAAAQPEGATN